VFSARWHSRLDDEALRALQNDLLEDPLRGDSIRGCGLLRKLRFRDQSRGKGKRGGLRVIYVFTPEAGRVDLITVYGKDEADDLSADEVRELCGYARMPRDEAIRAARTPSKKRKGRST
jgi:mRNA-degrading endonuclease RelE of RelBE toxin-antitoxin system